MTVDWDRLVIAPGQDMFAQQVVFYPIKSQPIINSVTGRGVLTVEYKSIMTEGEGLITSKTIMLSIRESEYFGKLPVIQDELMLPMAAAGQLRGVRLFIEDRYIDGQGAVELTLGIVVR